MFWMIVCSECDADGCLYMCSAFEKDSGTSEEVEEREKAGKQRESST